MKLNVITPRVKPMHDTIEEKQTLIEEIHVAQAMNP